MKVLILPLLALAIVCTSGCATKTRRFVEGEKRETVAGFSEEDINDTVSRAIQSIYKLDRIKLKAGANRAVVIVEDVTNDTLSRGREAGILAEALGQSLRENLMNDEKSNVVVYNEEAARYAKVKVEPQYRLAGRLTERNLRQDNEDFQKEYNLNLTLVDLDTGLEFWQKRIHVGKLVDEGRVMY